MEPQEANVQTEQRRGENSDLGFGQPEPGQSQELGHRRRGGRGQRAAWNPLVSGDPGGPFRMKKGKALCWERKYKAAL